MNAVRRNLWRVGAPVRWSLVGAIRLYRVTLSPMLGGQCRFYPTCSHYAEEAIRRRGATRGAALAVWRILRCNPFARGGLEPVTGAAMYDDIMPDRVRSPI